LNDKLEYDKAYQDDVFFHIISFHKDLL